MAVAIKSVYIVVLAATDSRSSSIFSGSRHIFSSSGDNGFGNNSINEIVLGVTDGKGSGSFSSSRLITLVVSVIMAV